MKNFMTILTAFSAVLSLFLCGCGEQPSAADGKIRVTAGLPPVAYIAKKIAGERISVQTMLPEGKSPHDYAPGPRDVRNASGAKLFLSTGLPFEVRAVKPLQSVKIVDVTKNAAKIPFG
ncbi:MAG: zinc ABC transporter substrate-binding protein, partial [Lentisphaeria bacterium]|nr:zinc ABC transporter substrate-binding protein [Lentisphaeria bacterium]